MLLACASPPPLSLSTSLALCLAPLQAARYGTTVDTMNILDSGVDTRSEDFKRNMEEMNKHIEQLRHNLKVARQGGGPKAIERHTSRGKLLARDRVTRE